MSAREPLDHWQGRLERHFKTLATSRIGTNFPTFALEHGLGDAELQILTRILGEQIRLGITLTDHWLVWAVYAAERGYSYDGHEYWQSFEQTMPRWRDRGRPEHLRLFFSRFKRHYNGFEPTGPWAGHFKNICWPIAHAILPRYFQDQFARAMFDARHQLARMHDASAAEAGKVLAGNAWDASSRFQDFLEQPELSGRIIQAMLGQAQAKGQSPIEKATLARIVTDLTRTRDAVEWLRATRQAVSDRFHGTYKARPSDGTDRPEIINRPVGPSETASVRPHLFLRRLDARTWAPQVEIPSFDVVARLSADLAKFLQATRCTIAGTGGVMLPGGWTLYGSQRRVLKAWPRSDAPLLSFERPHGALENILKGECRLSPGPVWVFRIGSDRVGREITGHGVRPGQRYVVLSRSRQHANVPFMGDTTVACEGVVGFELNVPEKVEQQEAHELARLGLQVARNVRVWPAGLCAPSWDGEGHGDWLSTEEPCLGFTHDHPVDEYLLSVDSGSEVRIDGAGAGQVVFVRLPRLTPGRHTVAIRPRRVGFPDHSQAIREMEGRLDINVRDPKPRKMGTTAHSGLVVSVDPPNPSLAEFWDGSVRLSVLGPENRQVRCGVLLEGPEERVILNEEIGRYPLPLSPDQWSRHIKAFTDVQKRAWTYLDATKGRFIIDADELGQFVLRLERSTTPLRWACRFEDDRAHLKLVDDTGGDAPAVVQFYSFENPAEAREFPAESVLHGYQIEGAGGVFLATQGQQCDSMVISNAHGRIERDQLLISPNLDGVAQNVPLLLSSFRVWHRSRLVGPLAESRRSHILAALLDRLYDYYCGSRWLQLEKSFVADQGALSQLKSAVDAQPSFAAVLYADHWKLSDGMRTASSWFSEVAKRYGVCTEPLLSAFVLQLASAPQTLDASYGTRLRSLVDAASKVPPLVRGARFLALLSLGSESNSSIIRLPRWQW